MTHPHPTTATRGPGPARRWRPLAAVALAGLAVLATGACTDDGGGGGGAAPTTETSTTTTTAVPGPVDDQTRPQSAFGMVHDGTKLWIADFYGGQVLAVDPETGAILVRYQGDDGVSDEIDDLAIGPDGAVYWTGFNDGAVGRMTPSGVVSLVAGLEPGLNSIAFSRDGTRLFVGRGVTGAGLWELDPTQLEKAPRLVSDELGNINSFDVGPDGAIYGPRWGTGSDGALVRIDPDTGQLSVVASGLDGPIAVKLDAEGTQAYVLTLPPGGAPAVSIVDLASRTTRVLATVPLTLADNLAVDERGRVFVTGFNEPALAVIEPDGTTRTIEIGTAAPADGTGDTTTTTSAPA